jgi:hypothetical protein
VIGPAGQPVPGEIEYRLINDADPDDDDVVFPGDAIPSFIWGSKLGTTTPKTTGDKTWFCRGGVSGASYYYLPQSCPDGTTYIENVTYQGMGCWDSSKGPGGGLGRDTGPVSLQGHMDVGDALADLNCEAPYTKVPRFSVIFRYPAAAIGGYLSSDDHDQDGDPDVIRGSAFHVDVVPVDGMDGQGRSFYQRVMGLCLNVTKTSSVTPLCQPNAAGELVAIAGPTKGTVVLDAGHTSPVVPVPESAVPLLGFDYTTAPLHYYSLTPVSPNPPWAPIPDPARVEAPPCGAFEKPLDWLHKGGRYTWTDSPIERQQLISSGWTFGKTIACTVPTTDRASVPLFRCDLPDGDRVLTVSTTERDQFVAQGGVVKTLGNAYPPQG